MLDHDSAKHIGSHSVVSTGHFGPGWVEVTVRHHAPDGTTTNFHVNKIELRSEDDSILQIGEKEEDGLITNKDRFVRPPDRSMRLAFQGQMFGDEDRLLYSVEIEDPVAAEGEGRDGE